MYLFLCVVLSNVTIYRFHKNPSSGSRVVPCGRTDEKTDVTKLIVDFHNFVNTPSIATGCMLFLTTEYYLHCLELIKY
jgi:hypothetical protein